MIKGEALLFVGCMGVINFEASQLVIIDGQHKKMNGYLISRQQYTSLTFNYHYYSDIHYRPMHGQEM